MCFRVTGVQYHSILFLLLANVEHLQVYRTAYNVRDTWPRSVFSSTVAAAGGCRLCRPRRCITCHHARTSLMHDRETGVFDLVYRSDCCRKLLTCSYRWFSVENFQRLPLIASRRCKSVRKHAAVWMGSIRPSAADAACGLLSTAVPVIRRTIEAIRVQHGA
jgi:hypothetical protein